MIKNKLNLQLFAEAVPGKKIVYLYRLLSDAATKSAVFVAFTTENSITISRDADSTATKDGAIRTPGEVEIEISTTAILSKNDETVKAHKQALIDGSLIEIWRVNLEEAGTEVNKFKATYYQGYLTEFEETANAEDYVEVSETFGINGTGVEGEATVTTAQQEAIELYAFKDTTNAGA